MINNEKTFNVRKILITLISSRWFLWRSKKHENTFWNFGTCFSYVLQIVKILFRQFWFVLTIMYYSNFRIAPPNLKLTVDLVRTLDLSEATWDESHHPLVICLSEWVPRFKSAGTSELRGQGGSDAGTGGAVPPPPILGRSVNPIPTMGGRFCPPFTSGTLNVFHLPASLHIALGQPKYLYWQCVV